ncbi:MAG: tetratricopeptide repeat protein [Defluviitaleaceae bacterium]|nr:tetratricopeptide repeat protein [Defluviitaleaceae bacterium]
MLQFCVSQQSDAPPFAFKATGIRVYSFEEALYHVYRYWRESVDDFLSDGMVTWVTDLGLTYIAARMKDLAKVDSFAERMTGFLRLAEYFNEKEIADLRVNLTRWETRREWEQLKDRGDYFLSRGEPGKALPLYRRALQYDENVPLLNNLAVAFMRLSAYTEAVRHLARARVLEPDNIALTLHYAEAAILCGEYGKGEKALNQASPHDAAHAEGDIPYLYGLMAYEKQDYPAALARFEEAMKQNAAVPLYAYKMADTYLKMRQFDKALDALKRVDKPDEEYFTRQAEIYAVYGNIPAAIKAIQQALMGGDSVNLWVRLAAYYRKDYDLERANGAIVRALSLDASNDMARLENARIKKGLGRMREYQAGLADVLRGFKQRYRQE